jgi:hypothetical protein
MTLPVDTPKDTQAFTLKHIPKSEAERALLQAERSYEQLKATVDLKQFDPTRMPQYLAQAERRTGIPYEPEEKAMLIEWAESGIPELQRMVAMELRVGISRKAEKEALAAMGQILLNRNNEAALQNFLQNDDNDPNLRAYVQTLIYLNRMEKLLGMYKGIKGRYAKWLKSLRTRLGLDRLLDEKASGKQQENAHEGQEMVLTIGLPAS